jgi:isoamylase
VDFVQTLLSIRHRYPVLRRNRFLTGNLDEKLGAKDVAWIHPSGAEMDEKTWADASLRCIGMLLSGRSMAAAVPEPGQDATLLLIFNGHAENMKFVFPPAVGGEAWRLQLDTNDSSSVDHTFRPGETAELTARSVSIFVMQ